MRGPADGTGDRRPPPFAARSRGPAGSSRPMRAAEPSGTAWSRPVRSCLAGCFVLAPADRLGPAAPVRPRSRRDHRAHGGLGQDSPCSHPAEWDTGRSPGRAVTSPTRPSPARRRHRSLSSPVAGPRAPSGVEARRSGAAAIAGSPSGEPATGRGHTPPPSATGTLPGGQGHGRVKRIRSGVTPSFRTPAALTPRQVMRRVAVCALPQVRRSSSTAPLPRAAIVSSGVSRT